MQRIKVTQQSLEVWTKRVQAFKAEGKTHGTVPEQLLGQYIVIENGIITVEDPNEKMHECGKCGGTGTYRWGPGLRYSGPCFDCVGKGFLTRRDRLRDDFYHEKEVEAAMRADAMRMK